MDYKILYNKYLSLTQNAIKETFQSFSNVPEPLISAMKYSVDAGGKRLRPVLMLAAAHLFGKNTENILPFAVSIEMIHTYSLIHDDLPCMDNDDLRRGLPTNHKVFGEGMAMLAGDGLLNMAYEILFEHILLNNETYNIKAAAQISRAAGSLGMVAGQCVDLYSGNNQSAGEKDLYYIHENKTGKLISAALVAGAYASNAKDGDVEIMRRFGHELGILFQITDDILDVVGDSKKMGKSTGKDEKQNKLTYPKIFGLEKSYFLANEKYDSIVEILGNYGENSKFLQELSFNMLNRNK